MTKRILTLLLLIASTSYGATLGDLTKADAVVVPEAGFDYASLGLGTNVLGTLARDAEIIIDDDAASYGLTSWTTLAYSNYPWSSYVVVGGVVVSVSLHNPFYYEPTNSYPVSFTAFDPPTTETEPLEQAPVFYEWTRQAGPSEVIAFAGSGIDTGTTYLCYGAIDTYAVSSNTLATSSLLILPSGVSSNDMYLLWPANTYGAGDAVAINKTEAWWAGPQKVEAGDAFSVYGRNLDLGDALGQLYIDGHGWVTNNSSNPYKVDFEMPALADGTYTIYAHNGHGQEYGWSESVEIEVYTKNVWDENTNNWINVTASPYNATGDGASDDLAALQAAWGACPQDGTVYLPTGVYAISSMLDLGYSTRRRIIGAGPTNSIITSTATYDGSSRSIQIKTSDCEYRSIGFNPGALVLNNFVFSNDGSDNVYTNCIFDDTNSGYDGDNQNAIVTLGANTNLKIENCKFIMFHASLFTGDYITIKDSEFRGWGDTYNTYLIGIQGTDHVSITGCTGQPHDTSDYTEPDGWSQGRFVLMDGNAGGAEHIYIGNNDTYEMAPRYNWDIDLYGGRHALTAYATAGSTSPNTVTVPGLDSITDDFGDVHLVAGSTFRIDNGTGESGKTYVMTDVNEVTGVITIGEAWEVAEPDATSLLILKTTEPKQAHGNAGEQILAEHQRTRWLGDVVSATSNTVEMLGASADYEGSQIVQPDYHFVTVTDGKGFGQTRRLLSNVGDVYTIVDPWRIIPDTGSTVAAGSYNRRIVVYDNRLDGPEYVSREFVANENETYPYSSEFTPLPTASCAVNFYGAHSDCIVDGNTITDVGVGTVNYGFIDNSPADTSVAVIMPNYFNLFQNNDVDGARTGFENVIGQADGDPTNYLGGVGMLASIYRNNTATNISEEIYNISDPSDYPTVTIVQPFYDVVADPTPPVDPPDPSGNPYDGEFVLTFVTTAADTFTLPCSDSGTYTGSIWCVDTSDESVVSSNTFSTYNDANMTVSVASAGTYRLHVTGTLPQPYFYAALDKDLMIGIDCIGRVGINSFGAMFRDVKLLKYFIAGDGSTTDGAVNFGDMFRGADGVTNMSFAGTTIEPTSVGRFCFDAKALHTLDISMLDTSQLTSWGQSFQNCTALTNITMTGLDLNATTDFSNFYSGNGLSSASYDAILNVMANQTTIQAGNTLDVTVNTLYSAAALTDYNTLTNTYLWTINDGGQE